MAEKIHDQYTDRSGAVLVKIANRMTDNNLAKLAINTLFGMANRPLAKTASFPSNSVTDLLLSRIYFEGQREKIASDVAKEIDERLSKYEVLQELDHKIRFKKVAASKQPEYVELLPLCKIASVQELVQAGEDFCKDYENLCMEDKLSFAHNFVKVADEVGVDLPDTVRIYTEIGVEANPDFYENMQLRKLAMQRQGKGTGGYDLLTQIDSSKLKNLNVLHKLATLINEADEKYNLREGKYSCLPDAWHSVFIIKKAEDADVKKVDPESLSKADIVSKYGDYVLDEVEREDGTIDTERLKEFMEIADGNGK